MATSSGGYSRKPSFVSPSKERQWLLQFSVGERKISSSMAVIRVLVRHAELNRFWTGPLSLTAGRTSLTRLAARGS